MLDGVCDASLCWVSARKEKWCILEGLMSGIYSARVFCRRICDHVCR